MEGKGEPDNAEHMEEEQEAGQYSYCITPSQLYYLRERKLCSYSYYIHHVVLVDHNNNLGTWEEELLGFTVHEEPFKGHICNF